MRKRKRGQQNNQNKDGWNHQSSKGNQRNQFSQSRMITLPDGLVLKKNTQVQMSILDMSETGEGIGKVQGYTVFVKDAVTGDVIEAGMTRIGKNYGYARVIQVLRPSPYRVTPVCAVAAACGGCQLQALSYEQQLQFKQQKVRGHMDRIAHLPEVPVLPVKGIMDGEGYHYRNKAQFPVQRGKDGRIRIGFYAGRTHDIIETDTCYLGHPVNEQILEIIRKFMEDYKINPYDEVHHTGCVRHIMIRTADATGEILVCLILKENSLSATETEALAARLRVISGMTSISLNLNPDKTNVIMGKEMILLYGSEYITDQIGDIQYQISAQSFYQVNSKQTKVLYETALEYADLSGDEIVWDLYCGIGTISLFLAQKAGKVYGVEVVPSAVENARANAKLNGITNAEFLLGEAEQVLPAWYEEHQTKADVIVTDPPRKGCDKAVLDVMVQMQPKRIVYVSCNSSTLARDLAYLSERGYQVEKVQPVDMFAQTTGVETVCLITRKIGSF